MRIDAPCHPLAVELGSADFDAGNIPSITLFVNCYKGLSVDKDIFRLSVRPVHFSKSIIPPTPIFSVGPIRQWQKYARHIRTSTRPMHFQPIPLPIPLPIILPAALPIPLSFPVSVSIAIPFYNVTIYTGAPMQKGNSRNTEGHSPRSCFRNTMAT